MRVFADMVTMIEEIRRDLAKSPTLKSSRVQATEVFATVHEAMNYSYSVPCEAVPEDAHELSLFGKKYFEEWAEYTEWIAWLVLESQSRFQPLTKTSRLSEATELRHPILKTQGEGNHYGYTYRERMIGMLASMESVLAKDLYSRRAYWPIYDNRDSIRASDMTRIPCTLGYHFMVRDMTNKVPMLHVTNLQRSCDFSRFWLSDLWFTAQAQRLLAERLHVEPGLIHHNILSFHSFIDTEIY